MPTRMIREGLLDSDRYARVSDASRLLFVHLMLLADDFGCVSVSATFLRRRCFYDSPSDERIARLVCELVDVDLIRTYEVERTCLAFIPKFRQRLYRSTLKHAIPPESLYQDDSDAAEKFNEIRKEITKTPVLPPGLPVLPPPEVKRSRSEEKRINTNTPLAKARASLFPENFNISNRVRQWALIKGHARLEERLEHFSGYARASGKKYADWDQAFMNSIRDDWAKLNAPKAPVYSFDHLTDGV